MHSRTASLHFCSLKNCFVNLPKSWTDKVTGDELFMLKIESSTGALYATWSGATTVSHFSPGQSEDVIEINGLFAAKQGLRNGQVVSATTISNVASCLEVYVEPASVDDWEILEMNASFIESNLLNQLRLISTGHVFPVWVQKTICIFIKIGQMNPEYSCCLLCAQTQVFVAPKTRSIPPPVQYMAEPAIDFPGRSPGNRNSDNEPSVLDAHDVTFTDEVVDEQPKHISSFTKILSFAKSIWFGENTGNLNGNSPADNAPVYKPEIWKNGQQYVCRVLSLEDSLNQHSNLDTPSAVLNTNDIVQSLLQQNAAVLSTEIYISAFSILSSSVFVSHKSIPSSFLAVLTRLHSPSEHSSIQSRQQNSRAPGSNSVNPLDEEAEGSVASLKIIVRVMVVGLNNSCKTPRQPSVPCGHILVPDMLRRQLNLKVTGKVTLSPVQMESTFRPASIDIYPLFASPEGFTKEMLHQAILAWFSYATSTQHPLVMNRGTMISCFIKQDFDGEFFMSFDARQNVTVDQYCLIDADILKSLSVHIKDQLTGSVKTGEKLPVLELKQVDAILPEVTLNDLIVPHNIIDSARYHINSCLEQPLFGSHMMSGLRAGSLLLCGTRGVGKSALGSALCRCAASAPSYAHVQLVDCKAFRGKKPESIAANIRAVFDEAAWHQPSVIFLDDLDQITAACSGPDQEMSGEAIYHGKVAQALRQIFKNEMWNGDRIAVIASCRNQGSLHKALVSTRGQHIFSKVLEIKPPKHEERVQILENLLSKRTSNCNIGFQQLNLSSVAARTEGFVGQDLMLLVDKTIHACRTSNLHSPGNILVSQNHFDAVLDSFVPSTLRSVPLLKPGDLSWADVGGLHDVRNVLQKTLLWPTKYPKLFNSCPLRLRSGLLLYGAPGTGKTLLAGVIAKEYSLNFICIKGPELLNKYIGASELAVRDTFMRAQSARPCILFFDEFDSLAPRRGHDSTGVTDRVVNQLLTQLDGIETLEGVYVLAATSRPDLIDPALLRPGRLDKSLHCPLPTEADRLEILKALSRHMVLGSDVDLSLIASVCEHFSGADLKALLYNSQLSAVHDDDTLQSVTRETGSHLSVTDDAGNTDIHSHEDITYIPSIERGPVTIDEGQYDQLSKQVAGCMKSLQDTTGSKKDGSKSAPLTIVVTQHHLLSAAKDMRPSVSPVERLKYQHIYESFVGSRGGNFSDTMQTIGERVTLA